MPNPFLRRCILPKPLSLSFSVLTPQAPLLHHRGLPLSGFILTSYRRRKIHTEVPVASYTKAGAERTTLKVPVNDDGSSEATTTPVSTSERKAVAFDGGIVSRMTPTMRKFTLGGKVAVVTGGARGLGWNMSQALAEAGAKAIALLDVKQELGDAAAAELHSTTGIPVQFYNVDVRDEKAIADVTAKVTADLGSIDIVINSAGIVDSNIKAETYDATLFRNLLDTNLTGSFLVSQACARHMIAARTGGSILFLSSIAGLRVLHPQQQCAYNASKAAVSHLAKSLAAEWSPHAIRVNTIAPGYMDTALNREALLDGQKAHWSAVTPMGRLGRPDELNGLAVFLASEASAFVTGAEILVDGGYAVY